MSHAAHLETSEIHSNASSMACVELPRDINEHQPDPDFLSSRIASYQANREFKLDSDFDHDIREECRADAVIKAERILTLLRNSLNEFQIGKIVQRLSQYTTLPRPKARATDQFYRSIWKRFGTRHLKEYKLLIAFLEGRDDDWMRQIDEDEQHKINGADPSVVFKLSPELVQDPKFIAAVFCYARIACLNSLRLIRRPLSASNSEPLPEISKARPVLPKKKLTALWQVKSDLCRMLDAEGLGHYADAMSIRPTTALLPLNGSGNRCIQSETEEDAQWAAFSLESDRIDFQIMMKDMEQVVALLMQELSEDDLLYLLLSVLSSLRTTKLHRKIFQEMVSNIRTRLPDEHQASIMSQLIPFLSGNSASLEDFQSPAAIHVLQHHQFRHQAIIRSLLECRMRIGHLLIHDIDDTQELNTVPRHLTPEERENVVTMAWNIANVLDDRQYHSFFCRFVRYKIAWRPNRPDFVGTFLEDIRQRIGPERAPLLMPLFRKTFADLSVETLTICRVKSRYSKKLIRQEAELIASEEAKNRFKCRWVPDRCVFYSNLPLGATQADVEKSLRHIGNVKSIMFFQNPVDGSTPKLRNSYDNSDHSNLSDGEAKSQNINLDDQFLEDMEPEIDGGDDIDEFVLNSVPHDLEDMSDMTKTKTKPKSKEANTQKKKRTRRHARKHKSKIIASAEMSQYCALVEFESMHAKQRALSHAMRIFGVMMPGLYEHRAVFASDAMSCSTISLQNIAFATPLRDIVQQINAIFKQSDSGLEISSANVLNYRPHISKGVIIPPRAYVTNGRLDLTFPTFEDAVQVIDELSKYLLQKKRRRPLSPEEEDAAIAIYKSVQAEGEPVMHIPSSAGRDTTSQATSQAPDANDSNSSAEARPFDVTWVRIREKHGSFEIPESPIG